VDFRQKITLPAEVSNNPDESGTESSFDMILLFSNDNEHRALRLERAKGVWKLESVSSASGALETCAAELFSTATKKSQDVIHVSEESRLLLLDSGIPSGLQADEVSEFLRWEVAAQLPDTEQGGVQDLLLAHQITSTGRVLIAVTSRSRSESLKQILSKHRLQLVQTIPAAASGWAAALKAARGGKRAIALVHESSDRVTLIILERGHAELISEYQENPTKAWPKHLLADLNSFDIANLFRTSAIPESDPPLKPELSSNEIWLLDEARALSTVESIVTLPCVAHQDSPKPIWLRVSAWWAAAAAIWIMAGTWVWASGQKQLKLMEQQLQQAHIYWSESKAQLNEYTAHGLEYERLNQELRDLELQLATAEKNLHNPSCAPCAKPEFFFDALAATAESCENRVRLRQFYADYLGRLRIEGLSPSDESIQEALGQIYSKLQHHPLLPVELTTTRVNEGSKMMQFVAAESRFLTPSDPAPPAPGAEDGAAIDRTNSEPESTTQAPLESEGSIIASPSSGATQVDKLESP